MNSHYFAVHRSFFIWLALLQLWVLGIDLLIRGSLIGSTAINAVTFVIALVLASSARESRHVAGAAIVWLLYLTGIALRGAGVVA